MERKKVISGLIWKLAERIGAQGVNLIVSIILARILTPEEYGIVALVTIFITISNVFLEIGFGTALIQKKDADDLDFSSVFYCNIGISLVLYLVIFLLAPFIASIYKIPQLTIVLRVLAISVLVAALKSIQNAYVSRNMLFKKFFMSTIIGTIISAIIGIWMAYQGFGVWALVTQQLTNIIIDTTVLWVTVKWRPILKFSFKRLKELFKFGWKMLCSGLIDTIYNELYGLSIGKIYSAGQLAYYNKANQFPHLITVNIDGSISSVMLPALSNEQDKKDKLKSMMRRAIKTSSYLLSPMLIGLAVVAEPLVKILLTDKWLPVVPLMQLLCFSYVLWPIHTINLQTISALGRSDIYLRVEIIKKVIGIIALIISCPFGITTMVIAKVVTSVIFTFINSYPNKKLIDYSFKEQARDILPYMLLAVTMGLVVYGLKIFINNTIILLILQVLIGALIYFSSSIILKLDAYMYLINMIKNRKGKKDE